MKKDLKFFVKINSLSVIFTTAIILFIISLGIYGLITTDYTFQVTPPAISSHSIVLVSTSYPPLMGLMSGGFYFHNLSLPVLKSARDKTKNVRDVFLGYSLACVSYLLCGFMGYFGFNSQVFNV